jgi:hypothetical protein
MREKINPNVTVAVVQANTVSHKEADKDLIQQRKLQAVSWAATVAGTNNESVYAPIVSPKLLYDDVMNDPILSRCLRFIARTVGGLGHDQVPSPYADKVEISEKQELKKWVSKIFQPSLAGVFENFIYDFAWAGFSVILIDTNKKLINTTKDWYLGKEWTTKHYEASKIRHINRMRVFKLMPRTKKDTDKYDQMDIIFPRYIILSSTDANSDYFFAKTYGDPRFFTRADGKETTTHNGTMEAPQVFCWTQYCPEDEANGYPSWMSAKTEVDTHYEARKYEYDHFKNNCIPNLIIIAPRTKTTDGRTGADLTKTFLEQTIQKRADGGGQRTALVLEFPPGSEHKSTGQVPLEIREIKGPPPDQFIALKTQIVQNIATSCDMSANLILPYDKGMGSGKDKIEDLRQFKTFTAEPLRVRANTEILEQVLVNNSVFNTFLILLKEIDTSDPEMESKIAKAWDEISVLNNGEKRAKMNVPHMIYPEDPEKSKKFDEIIFMDFSRKLFTFDSLNDLDATLAGMEQIGDEEQFNEAQKKMAHYLKKILRGITPTQFRNTLKRAVKEIQEKE